jgi:hypothetical protein
MTPAFKQAKTVHSLDREDNCDRPLLFMLFINSYYTGYNEQVRADGTVTIATALGINEIQNFGVRSRREETDLGDLNVGWKNVYTSLYETGY